LFCLFLVLSLVYVSSLGISSKKKTHKGAALATGNEAPLRGYYWVQRFYPGNDPIDNVKESEFHTRQMYFELNKEMLFFSKSLERIEDVEDSIALSDLYDAKVDDVASGRCCSRITYNAFPGGKGLETILVATAKNTKKGNPIIKTNNQSQCVNNCKANPLTAVSTPKKQLKKTRQSPRLNANFCLDLYVPDEARWRVCSVSQDKISRLHMKILFNILSAKLKGSSSITNFLTNARVGRETPVGNWNWSTQEKWKGKCKTTFMQSPINIIKSATTKAKGNFSVSHHLMPVHTLIKRNFKEVIVAFMNFGGLFQITIDNTYLLFTPVYMSFRFPGEHLIDGIRPMGEILLHFAELSTQRKTSTTSGFIFTIPIMPTKEGLNIDSLEDLNIDFWKFEVEKHGTYAPKKFLKKKLLAFDLAALLKKLDDLKPNYHFYFGSQPTPPCLEQSYHLLADKPLSMAGCQFKLLRDNSLFSAKAKEIHVRMEKPMNDRRVYSFSSASFKYIPNISGLIPQSFNKYLLLHGYGYKGRSKYGRYGPWGKYFGKGRRGQNGLFGDDEWLDELNCDLPNDNNADQEALNDQ